MRLQGKLLEVVKLPQSQGQELFTFESNGGLFRLIDPKENGSFANPKVGSYWELELSQFVERNAKQVSVQTVLSQAQEIEKPNETTDNQELAKALGLAGKLQAQNQQVIEENKALQAKNEQLAADNNDLRNQITEATATRQQLQDRVDDLKNQLEVAQAREVISEPTESEEVTEEPTPEEEERINERLRELREFNASFSTSDGNSQATETTGRPTSTEERGAISADTEALIRQTEAQRSAEAEEQRRADNERATREAERRRQGSTREQPTKADAVAKITNSDEAQTPAENEVTEEEIDDVVDEETLTDDDSADSAAFDTAKLVHVELDEPSDLGSDIEGSYEDQAEARLAALDENVNDDDGDVQDQLRELEEAKDLNSAFDVNRADDEKAEAAKAVQTTDFGDSDEITEETDEAEAREVGEDEDDGTNGFLGDEADEDDSANATDEGKNDLNDDGEVNLAF
ncbi:hypothetical protein HCY78_05480 [Limosilactobacillus fermentum]